MNARDYADWCECAGLYIRNVSHADRYRTYQAKLSRPGFITYLVHDFLAQNENGIDLSRWRSQNVYERGDDAAYRVEQTAQALEAVGAPRVAAKARTARDTSISGLFDQYADDPQGLMAAMRQVNPAEMMAQLRENIARMAPGLAAQAGLPVPEPKPVAPDAEIEPTERVEHLLQRYAEAHDADLRADVAKFGDVRTQPRFNRRKRMKELDRLRDAEADRQRQRDHAEELTRATARMEEKLVKDPAPSPGAIASLRRKFLESYRRYAGRPADELVPELREPLRAAQALQEQYPGVFRPEAIDDPELSARLAAIGPYDVDIGKRNVHVSWDEPRGLGCDWTTFSLSIEFPAGKTKRLRRLLNGYDRLCRRFNEHQAALRAQVLESFEIHRDWIARMGFEGYDLDASGAPTERAILSHARSGHIRLNASGGSDDSSIGVAVYFRVDWDEEHGLELFVDDEPDVAPEAATQVAFHDTGPRLTPNDIAAFETEYAVTLPADYRAFLLAHNGGRPEPNHLQARVEGELLPIDVVRFFGIVADEERGVGAAFTRHLAEDLPPHLLPVGQAQTPDPFGATSTATLLLGLAGKQSGKVLLAMSSPYSAMGRMIPAGADPATLARARTAMFEAICTRIAPALGALLSRLVVRPSKPVPEWLQAIRAGDAERFRAWLVAGGKLDETFTQYGDTFAFSVVDYLAREASRHLLDVLVKRKVVRVRQLRDSWIRSNLGVERFRALMPVLPKDEWRHVLTRAEVWDDAGLLDELAAAGVDWNAGIDNEGATPLHWAVRCQRPDGVRWLLEHGAEAGKADEYGRTALVWAENERSLDSLKLLIEAGESFDGLFPHMPTMQDKLRLLRSRWLDRFDALEQYLRSRGVVQG